MKSSAKPILRSRPRGDYIKSAQLAELHVLTEHWLMDLDFYADEIHFFYHLVDKYFALLLKEEHLNEAQIIVSNIHALEKDLLEIKVRLKTHLAWIDKSYAQDEVYDEESFRQEHQELEDDVSDLLAHFKRLKIEVFELSNKMLEVEKLTHLLTR